MNTNVHRRGGSALGILVAIIVLAVAGGAAWYFLSDVGQTKMEQAYASFARWTPQNIAADPKAYLDFCEAQAKQAKADLKAASVRVAQQEATVRSRLDEAQGKIDAGRPVLEQFKAAYKQAAADDAFPVTVRDKQYDQEALKKQIVSLHHEIEAQQGLVESAEAALKTLRMQEQKIQAQRAACDEQLRLIEVNRAKVEIQEITDDLREQLVSIKGVLQTAVAVTGDQAQPLTLDDIATEAQTTVDDAAFEAILNQ